MGNKVGKEMFYTNNVAIGFLAINLLPLHVQILYFEPEDVRHLLHE